MRFRFLTVACLLLGSLGRVGTVWASQSSSKQTPEKTKPVATILPRNPVQAKPDEIVFYTMRNLFAYIYRNSKKPPRSTLETDEEYNKRVSINPPKGKLWYIYIAPKSGRPYEHTYNSSKQELTITADGLMPYCDKSWFSDDKTVFAFLADSYFTDSKFYTVTTPGGIKKRVDSYSSLLYVLRIVNGDEIPKVVNGSNFYTFYSDVLKTSIYIHLKTKLPPDQVNRFANRAEVLMGVELIGAGNSGIAFVDHSAPTASDLTDVNTYRAHLSVNLREVILRDRETKKVYATVKVPSDVPSEVGEKVQNTPIVGSETEAASASFAQKFSGSESKTTDSFYVPAKKWKITWTAGDSSAPDDFGYFSISLRNAKTNELGSPQKTEYGVR